MIDILKNRIEAMNAVSAYINEVGPKLIADIAANGYRMKANSNVLFAKDQERLMEIVKSNKDERIHSYLCVSEYSGVSLSVKASYQVTEHSVNYYEDVTYVGDNAGNNSHFSPRPIHNLEEVREQEKLIRPLQDQIRALEDQLRAITRITSGR